MPMFEQLSALLARAEVGFLVVAGPAVARAGFQRFTGGADLLVTAAPDNLRRLIDAPSGFGDGVASELTPDAGWEREPSESSTRS